MSQRIVINKNIRNNQNADLQSIFDTRYGKKEIVIDNTEGDEGLWILSEEGNYKKVSLNPVIISGLSENQVADIARSIIESDASANFAKASKLAELSASTKENIEILSGDVETLSERMDNATQELTEYIDEKIENIDISSLPDVTQEMLERISSLVKLMEDNPDIMESIQMAIDGHIALTRAQYDELIANGRVTIGDRVVIYNSKTYYNIYEEEGGDEDSYEYDEETGMLTILGDVSIDEDGMVEISATVDSDGYISVNGGESEDEDIVIDDEGLVEVSDEQIDEDGFINIPDSWEIM